MSYTTYTLKKTYEPISDIPISKWIIDEGGEFVSYDQDIESALHEVGASMLDKFDEMCRWAILGYKE